MSPLARLAIAAALALQDGGGTAKRFLESLDRDGDGFVSRAEWSGSGAVFLRIDADHDGYLSLQELAHMNDKPAPPVPPAPPDPAEANKVAIPIGVLPDPPELFKTTCLKCHNQERIERASKTADGWRDTVTRMQNKKNAKFNDKEAKQILEWLLSVRAPLAKNALRYASQDPKRDWALLFGGGDLEQFDRDRNGKLDAGELARLMFERADLDRSNGLSPGEFALLPLAADRRALFAKLDRDHDGIVTLRELGTPSAPIEICDTNGDQMLSHDEIPRARGVGGPYTMILATDAKTALALLDQNHDERLSARELEHFPGTLKRFDKNGDGELDLKELESAVTAARAEGPYAAFDDFLTRYDLDQDGAVSRAEFPGSDALFARLDVDGDGAITAKDAAGPVKRPAFDPDAMRWR
jgi:Ca2+-binding EF-hand superfamily protein